MPNRTIFDKITYQLAIGLGSGLAPVAPGTFGSAAAVLIAFLVYFGLGFWAFFALFMLSLLAGSYICSKGSAVFGMHDNPHIVFDEWVGVWLVLLLPFLCAKYQYFSSINWQNTFTWCSIGLLCFALFRLFDIIKPTPIGWVDANVSGGFGILIDDVLAGIMATLVLYVLLQLWTYFA